MLSQILQSTDVVGDKKWTIEEETDERLRFSGGFVSVCEKIRTTIK